MDIDAGVEKLSINRFASLCYNLLLKTSRFGNNRYVGKLWRAAWQKSCHTFACPVSTIIHGHDVAVNYGYTYPLNSRLFSSYNNPLVELVYQCFSTKKAPIRLIDIGAAVGDTILLVYSNCPSMVDEFYCIDGDKEFFVYLQKNLEKFNNGKLFLSMLSDGETQEKELIRTHKGTASAQGVSQVSAKPLDIVLGEIGSPHIDLIKIDVDGFDGKVLLGSKRTLSESKPAVIFEWHPILCDNTENNCTDHFDVLTLCGYTQFVWFTKFGDFSHFMNGFDKDSVANLAKLSFRGIFNDDWHYDVIALHQGSEIDPVKLAEASFAKARRSKF